MSAQQKRLVRLQITLVSYSKMATVGASKRQVKDQSIIRELFLKDVSKAVYLILLIIIIFIFSSALSVWCKNCAHVVIKRCIFHLNASVRAYIVAGAVCLIIIIVHLIIKV